MPRPLRKRVPPRPQRITIRQVDGASAVRTIEPQEIDRVRRERELSRNVAAYTHDGARHSLQDWARARELRRLQAILALRLGDVVHDYASTGDLWWFVIDVNGVGQTVTARTMMVGQPFEKTFTFSQISVASLDDQERQEARLQFQGLREGPARRLFA